MGETSEAAYAALSGKSSASNLCGGGKLLVPGAPNDSLFYTKLAGSPCGDRMPQGADPLTADELAMVKSWILAGAKND
jgi:hypothetical protein